MSRSLILSIDQGTSSTKAIVFDDTGELVVKATNPLSTNFLDGGLVEQDAEEIYQNVRGAVRNCLKLLTDKGASIEDIQSCGISNQRETFVVWDKSGRALYPAIVWQCKRSIAICERLKTQGLAGKIKKTTGLIIDPYFSGTKLIWLYENVRGVKEAVDAGNAFFGTIDSWLLYRLTGGRSYLTDYTNASRTLFFNLKELKWDEGLISGFGLSRLNLPEPKPSCYHFGKSHFDGLFQTPLAITAMAGDSHAAAFGEGCFTPGTAKATLGTGCSLLMNIGDSPKESSNGMVTTICWSTTDTVQYAFEGVIVSCGSTIEWLKNELGLFQSSDDTGAMANAVPDNGGVYVIPAFSGLGAPHWDMTRKASIVGLSFDSRKNHIVRAALESIPYQIKDVITAMESDMSIRLRQLMVDGGISSNDFVIRFLADLLDKPVVSMKIPDVSALGAAYLAGLQKKIFRDIPHISELNSQKKTVNPSGEGSVKQWYQGWLNAIRSTGQSDNRKF